MFQLVLDWSEVWALFIPITILMVKQQPAKLKLVVAYVWAALIINLAIDLVWKFRMLLPPAYNSNNFLYNLHSAVRFYLFSAFFIHLQQPFWVRVKKIMPVCFTLFMIINFTFFENFFDYWKFSSRLLSIEAALLLFYVLQYYLFKINDNIGTKITDNVFWVVTGLGIFVALNFFIFLLYNELTLRFQRFAISLWSVHNISYIILNLFLAKGFYESGKQ
ncbi:hypothetical protein OC25_20460 [Pedobacter kyungheensis]|uniref:Uncharacterized protein n=1 Tax=Pedobacter kyungheensis TaxID=1069985 RepID=A0A0C1FFF6_9SPHI|nr:hypothetical protein OC25_20460 [Pedobacter kyungheensis]